ncbi:MAG: hypothetical protein GY953_36900, partial [bacterium]|nr:hypothetical protein [bacterium]
MLVLLLASTAAAQVVPGHYIVELTEEPAAAAREKPGQRRATAMAERRNQVWSQQATLRRVLDRYEARAIDTVDTVANALLVKMPDHLAARLAAIDGVKRVAPVYEYRASLERAIPLHRVPEAWQRLGGADGAGAGVSIGIIDTGIDNRHPGFVDLSIPVREGFPRVNRTSDLVYTSNKVIVARSYLSLLGEADSSARDSRSHGTGVAMAAAGVIQATENG